jgi:hypothetical protein
MKNEDCVLGLKQLGSYLHDLHIHELYGIHILTGYQKYREFPGNLPAHQKFSAEKSQVLL